MDPLREGFDQLERAFRDADLRHEPSTRVSSSLKHDATHASTHVPTTVADIPDSESDLVSPISNDDHEPFDVTITPPPGHPELRRHHSGLPPTPPTMTNSDVAEPKPDRSLSPVPLFADRVRNALESQRSGYSTPVDESLSPPTPDPSPPGALHSLSVPRPLLSHHASSQSHAESFQTATEGLSTHGDTSEADTETEDNVVGEENRRMLSTPKAVQAVSAELQQEMERPDLSEVSDKGEARPKTYQLESDTDRSEVRVKNYQAESDSDMDRSIRSGKRSAKSDIQASPSLRKALDIRATNQRLRKPFQPGDAIKRPDDALIYGSLGLNRFPNGAGRGKAQPRREMDTEFLRNAEFVPSKTPDELLKAATPKPLMEKTVSPVGDKAPQTPNMPAEIVTLLREFAPSAAPPDPSPPNTAGKASLKENNMVYRMIQEENAKRHSALSDGSVQAMVILVPEHPRKLRKAPKRESLRGDASLTGDSKRSSSESGHKLRHKRAMSLNEATGPVSKAIADEDALKFSSRISRFDSGEHGFDYWSAVPDPTVLKRSTVEAKISSIAPSPSDAEARPHRLRRSLRESELYRSSPLSTPSPKLRRSSHDHRLENSTEVRRTSLSRGSQTVSQKLHFAAEDLTREGREIRDRISLKEPPASFDRNFQAAASPRRKSFDLRHLQPNGTPFSTSQMSDRTEAELLEARGVEIFPHNNHSLLLIQQASQVNSKPVKIDIPTVSGPIARETQARSPVFEAYVEEPQEPLNEIGKPKYAVDSPLTNPRAAPEPPVIKFIPPTPSEEVERALGESADANSDPRYALQRNLSLSQRVRRYSESLIQPLPFGRSGSLRNQNPKRVSTMPEARPTYLSSFWQPRDFWEEYDSDEASDDYEPLPPGGDTSEVTAPKPRGFIPRNMSVRMPGFRGTGGFLVGNSLGLDRHGTNNRRHYVSKRTSEEMMRRFAERKRRRTFTLPFSGGTKVEYVGFSGLGARMRAGRKKRQDKALEKRREALRGQIGTRVYHDGR